MLSVRGKPSSLTHRAISSLRSNERSPAIRSEAAAPVSWMEIWTLSSPSSRKRASRSRLSGIPLVIRFV